jgi:hypothetical protein
MFSNYVVCIWRRMQTTILYWSPSKSHLHESLMSCHMTSRYAYSKISTIKAQCATQLPQALGGAVGCGTALQVERSSARFSMVSLEYFIDIMLLAALWPWGSTQPLTEMSTIFMWRPSWNVGATSSWNPQGITRIAFCFSSNTAWFGGGEINVLIFRKIATYCAPFVSHHQALHIRTRKVDFIQLLLLSFLFSQCEIS